MPYNLIYEAQLHFIHETKRGLEVYIILISEIFKNLLHLSHSELSQFRTHFSNFTENSSNLISNHCRRPISSILCTQNLVTALKINENEVNH